MNEKVSRLTVELMAFGFNLKRSANQVTWNDNRTTEYDQRTLLLSTITRILSRMPFIYLNDFTADNGTPLNGLYVMDNKVCITMDNMMNS